MEVKVEKEGKGKENLKENMMKKKRNGNEKREGQKAEIANREEFLTASCRKN